MMEFLILDVICIRIGKAIRILKGVGILEAKILLRVSVSDSSCPVFRHVAQKNDQSFSFYKIVYDVVGSK